MLKHIDARWIWILRYLAVIALALVLGALLGEMGLFKATKLGRTGVNAARIAEFLGFGGALLVFWLLARRAAALLPADERWNAAKSTLVPLATLIAVAAAQAVLLRVLGPLMGKGALQVYNWLFVFAIILSAAWLVGAAFTGSVTLAPLFSARAKPVRRQERMAGRA